MNDSEHVDDDLQELLDGRLSPAARARVEAHIAACDECRRAWISLRQTSGVLRGLGSREVPADLVANIERARVREAHEEGEPGASAGAARARRKWLLTSALVAAAALILLVVYLRRPDLPAMMAADHARYVRGDLGLEIQNDRADVVDAFLARRVPFPPRVFDLGMMNYALVGGRVHSISGRPSAFFVYRGAGGRIVICQMYQGTVEDLPAGAERREHNGIPFFIYGRGARTVVFWQEGDVTCVLVSDGAAEDVIQLAFAKAMR